MSQSLQRLPASAGPDAIFAAFKKDGAVLIQNFITLDTVQRFINEVETALQTLPMGVRDGVEGIIDAGIAAEMIGPRTKRLCHLVSRSAVFRHELLEHDLMHTLLERVFVDGPMDGYWMNASELIEITPGSKAQPIHRDQELYPAWDAAGPAMPEAICNFITAMTPFTERNGATRVAPGTHVSYDASEHLLDKDFKGRADLSTLPATMDMGDCIFFSGKVLHGGGANVTEDENRRGLAISFIRRILTPEIAHSLTVPRDIVDTMSYRGQAMLGFRSQWPVVKDLPNFYWSYQGTDVGTFMGLTDKTVTNGTIS